MNSLLLIFIGVGWLNVLYYSLKTFLVKWLCCRVLGDWVQFESDPTYQTKYSCNSSNNHKGQRGNGLHKANGVCNGHTNDAPRVNGNSNGSVLLQEKKAGVVLSEGDVSEISQLIVGQVVGISSSVASIIIMWQTRDDVIHSKSWILTPFSHLFAWYFLIDLLAMMESFTLRKNLSGVGLWRRLNSFLVKKWPHVVHHLLIFVVAYPLTVNYSLRGNMGDFILGALMAEDFSTPFVSFAKILKLMKLDNTTPYKVNGLVLVPIFFVARILNIPLAFLAYAAQYHSWNIWTAVKSMTFVCHFFNIGQWLLQFYWFTAIIGIVTGAVRTYIKTRRL